MRIWVPTAMSGRDPASIRQGNLRSCVKFIPFAHVLGEGKMLEVNYE
jgi:hypothetical protein